MNLSQMVQKQENLVLPVVDQTTLSNLHQVMKAQDDPMGVVEPLSKDRD
jgi:hypothetical protein